MLWNERISRLIFVLLPRPLIVYLAWHYALATAKRLHDLFGYAHSSMDLFPPSSRAAVMSGSYHQHLDELPSKIQNASIGWDAKGHTHEPFPWTNGCVLSSLRYSNLAKEFKHHDFRCTWRDEPRMSPGNWRFAPVCGVGSESMRTSGTSSFRVCSAPDDWFDIDSDHSSPRHQLYR